MSAFSFASGTALGPATRVTASMGRPVRAPRHRRVPRTLPRSLGVAALFYPALGLPIAAFQVLVGAGRVGIGAVMFLVIGNPTSGGSSAPELLRGFWRDLSQLLPPGAATTAMRDVVYFHGHGMASALLDLGLWAILGATVVITVNILRARARGAPPRPRLSRNAKQTRPGPA
jgi:hypothetical protein